MCQGQRLREAPAWQPPAQAPDRARAGAELEAVRAQLLESMARLERERARAADIRRRLEESYAERDRIKRMASALAVIRGRLAERRRQLELDVESAESLD